MAIMLFLAEMCESNDCGGSHAIRAVLLSLFQHFVRLQLPTTTVTSLVRRVFGRHLVICTLLMLQPSKHFFVLTC